MYKVFIDGQAGTTGLEIYDRLSKRQDIEILLIDEKDRKLNSAKQSLFKEADLAILCLPDEAARLSADLAGNTRIIDASTAFRVDKDWVYGLPELNGEQRQKIANATRVSNPGCYPTGFLLAIAPLTQLLHKDVQLSISAVSGYSGGGRQLIEKYESNNLKDGKWASRPYALKFGHKHIPEMQHYAGLSSEPLFMPSVGSYKQGMLVSTPLSQTFFKEKTSTEQIAELLQDYYANEDCVNTHKANSDVCLDAGFLDPQGNNNTNRNDIHIFGNENQFLLVSQLDNLGKGASGAAIQNLNIMLGVDELKGLTL